MDLFWPRTLLIEQKSSRLDLGKAQGQALTYIDGNHPTEQPRWVRACDFHNWHLLDLETGDELKFHLQDLHKHITAVDFMLGRRVSFENQASVTIKAAELMGKLHDALEDAGYTGHDLEQFLVRILFCLFADDTGIFQPKDIRSEEHTSELQSLMRISYAVFCLKKKTKNNDNRTPSIKTEHT